jgi:hypothetical protein
VRARIVTTSKILVVAATACAPACTGKGEGDATRPSSPAPIAIAAAEPDRAPGYPLQAPVRVEGEKTTETKDPVLLALRDELVGDVAVDERRPQVLAAAAHFRPLCDAEGYPLVGNVLRKTMKTLYQPKDFCADVRKNDALLARRK